MFSDILLSPVMNTDFTSLRRNGKTVQVAVCATPDTALYFARRHKGHKGVAGTPVEDYQGILVHDHDRTYYHYGGEHQECLAHVLRYLKGSIENEPHLKWNTSMWKLLREMIHYRNRLHPKDMIDRDKVNEYENQYQKILEVAKREYEYEPPSDYYKEGYNLYKRLYKYSESHLLFLHNNSVPTTNNLSERLLRMLKRKGRQVMSFRSDDSIHYLCNSMGVIASLRVQTQNLYGDVTSIFG